MKQGCFNWYLEMSGSFVTAMAQAIQRADTDNKGRIRKAFPQMIAAYECNCWENVPEGFDKNEYNANPIN